MHAERLQRLGGHDPGAERRREGFGLEGSERHSFPLLDVPSRPIVQKREAEYRFLRLGYGQRFAHRIGLPDDDAHFELEIELGGVAKCRRFCARRFGLANGAADRGARHDNGRGAAIIGNGDVQPIGQQAG